jgi:beta-lactamase regulating signal transducer with metallopeptidase domain
MNELLCTLSLRLCDYFVVATALLAAAALAGWRIRQPAQRMALAWGTMAGLTVLAVATALPNWPRIDVRQWVATQTFSDHEPLLEPVVTFKLIPLADQPQPAAAAPPALLPTAAENPLTLSLAHLDAIAANWLTWPALSWLAVAAVTLAWIALGAAQSWRLLWMARQPPLWVQTELARLVGRRRKPRLKTSTHIGSAVALGAIRPAILLPDEHVRDENLAGVQAALAHEWAHIHHGDLWLLAWQRLLLPLLAAHPLFWLLRRQIRADQELLADIAAAGERPVEYAEALLAWAKQAGPRPIAGVATLAMWENPQTVSRRIQMILDPKNPVARKGSRLWQWLFVLGLAAIGGGLSVVSLRSQPVAAQEDESHRQEPRTISSAGPPAPTAQIQQVELVVTMVRLGKEGQDATKESIRDLMRHFGEQISFDNGVCVVALPRQQVESALKSLREAGQAKILSQPKLMTISGRDSYFADGGELPSIRETDYGDRRIETIEYHSLRSLRIRPEVRTQRTSHADSRDERPTVVRLSVTRENVEPSPRMLKRQLTFTADVPIGRTLLLWELKAVADDEANLVLITPIGIHRVTREVLANPQALALDIKSPAAQLDAIDPKAVEQIQAASDKLRAEAERNMELAEQLKRENARLRQRLQDLVTQINWLRSVASQESKDQVSDAEFIRRVYLDLMGIVPRPEEVKTFLDSSDARKREKLIDNLLADPKVADHWTRQWKELIARSHEPVSDASPDQSAKPPPPERSIVVIQLKHMLSDRAVELAKAILQLDQTSGAGIVADPRTNSIVFHGAPQEAKVLEAVLKVIDQPVAVLRGIDPGDAAEADQYAAGHDLVTQRQLLELDLQTAETDIAIATAELEDAKKLGTAISAAELRQKEAALRHAELRRQRTKILLQALENKKQAAARPPLYTIEEGMVPPKNLRERIWQTLGLTLESTNDAIFKKLNSVFRGGLTVTDVRPGGPADERGILKGDILVGLDRWEMRSLENVAYVLENDDLQKAGETSFHVLRDGKVLVGRMPLVRSESASPAKPLAATSEASFKSEDLTINIRLAEIDLRQAKLKLGADAKQLDRITKLAASANVSQTEVDAAQIAVQQAQLSVERAQAVLEGLKSQQQPKPEPR